MAKTLFYSRYVNLPPKVFFEPDTETCFVSQSEVQTSGLKYQLHQYGFDSLAQRMEDMRDKFGYADCTKIDDFRESMNKYVAGKEYFEALPSEIRRKYNDLPELFYEDCVKSPETAYKAGFISEQYYQELKNKNNNDITSVNDKNVGDSLPEDAESAPSVS